MERGHGTDEHAQEPSGHKRLYVLIALAVIAVAVIAVTASGSGHHSTVTVGSNLTSTEAAPTAASNLGCTTGPVSDDLRITIYGGSESVCTEFNQGAAKSSGEYWKTKPEGEALSGELVCSMSKGGSRLIEVRDTGGHFNGNHVCANLVAKGWHEAEGPGAKIEREQAQAKAERERTEIGDRNAENERAAQKRQVEQAKLEKDEAAQRRQEGREHAKEDQEHKQEEAKQHQELERENRHVEEETHRAEHEAEASG
jgi:hypothetical protein